MERLNYRHTPYLFYIPEVLHHCTLNNFDFKGQSNNLIKTIRGFVEGDVNGIFFYGGFGVGKSHLLVSLYRVMVDKEDDISNIYYSSLESSLRNISTDQYFIEYLCNIGLLFLDDITAANLHSKENADILRRIINERYEARLRTCFSSNAGPKELTDLGLHPHAISRIQGMCEIVKIIGKDRRGV